jgi:nitrite reductase (NADH) large subunit
MAAKRLLVAGNGMAGQRLLEQVMALTTGRLSITVAGDQPEPAYNRVLLSPLHGLP